MSPTTHTNFTLASPAGTDIWRKPPSTNAFTAPTYPSTLPSSPLSSFTRARITFSLPPAPHLRQYDQAGLLLHFTNPNSQDKWIKTGVEFYHGKPYISTVCTDRWSDWSVVPHASASSSGGDGGIKATLEARREGHELGKSLWVYLVVSDGKGGEEKLPLREVNWVFAEEGWSVAVGAYVARPTEEGGEGALETGFEVLEVEFGA